MAQAAEAPFVLLVESHRDPDQERARLFEQPERLICCQQPRDVPGALAEIEEGKSVSLILNQGRRAMIGGYYGYGEYGVGTSDDG